MPTVDYYRRQLARRAYTEPAPRTGEVERWRRPEEPVVITVQTEPEYRDVVRYVDRPAPARTYGLRDDGCRCLEHCNQMLWRERSYGVMAAHVADVETDPFDRAMYSSSARRAPQAAAVWEQTREDILRFGCHALSPACPDYRPR